MGLPVPDVMSYNISRATLDLKELTMSVLPLLFFIFPLGLDTLGVSISLGIKSQRDEITAREGKGLQFPAWLNSAVLFSLAETLMPLVGLAIGYATSLFVSHIMHVVGPLILIGVGLWELLEEGQEYIHKKRRSTLNTSQYYMPAKEQFQWRSQLLLAFSISLDELAIGFSLGTITVSHVSGVSVYPFVLCILIGMQGFLMTLIGIALGRTLRTRLRTLKEWTEFLSAFLLIGLGIWLLVA
jgi:putative Mn2+ efflux pump MntP